MSLCCGGKLLEALREGRAKTVCMSGSESENSPRATHHLHGGEKAVVSYSKLLRLAVVRGEAGGHCSMPHGLHLLSV